MISLFLAFTAFAADPCPRAYVPGAETGGFLAQRLEKSGLKISKPERWNDFVKAEGLGEETSGFDQLDQDVFLRRLEELPMNELRRLYPEIGERKLRGAKERMNPCGL